MKKAGKDPAQIDRLEDIPIDKSIKDVFLSKGLSKLYPPQAKARQIIHDGIGATVAVRAFAAMAQHGGELAQASGMRNLADESLHEHAVEAVVLHPFEMPQHGLAVEGAEHFRRAAVGELEGRGVTLVGIEFAHIGPQINLATARLEAVAPIPVIPAATAAVALRREPALVAGHDLAGQRRAIHALLRRAGVGLHGFGDDLVARQRARRVGSRDGE